MNKLAIYGDSWFDPYHGHDSGPELEKYAWMFLLKDHFDVTTFGKNASGVYYSYKKFLDTHTNFDRIIFGATISTRWGNGFIINGKEKHFNNYGSVDGFLNKSTNLINLSAELVKELETLRDYYYYLVDAECTDIMKRLMVEDVKRIRPDAIIMDVDQVPIAHYRYYQAKSFGVPTVTGANEIRCVCHFTPEFNRAMSRNVLNMLNTGDWGKLETDINISEDFNYFYNTPKEYLINRWKNK